MGAILPGDFLKFRDFWPIPRKLIAQIKNVDLNSALLVAQGNKEG